MVFVSAISVQTPFMASHINGAIPCTVLLINSILYYIRVGEITSPIRLFNNNNIRLMQQILCIRCWVCIACSCYHVRQEIKITRCTDFSFPSSGSRGCPTVLLMGCCQHGSKVTTSKMNISNRNIVVCDLQTKTIGLKDIVYLDVFRSLNC